MPPKLAAAAADCTADKPSSSSGDEPSPRHRPSPKTLTGTRVRECVGMRGNVWGCTEGAGPGRTGGGPSPGRAWKCRALRRRLRRNSLAAAIPHPRASLPRRRAGSENQRDEVTCSGCGLLDGHPHRPGRAPARERSRLRLSWRQTGHNRQGGHEKGRAARLEPRPRLTPYGGTSSPSGRGGAGAEGGCAIAETWLPPSNAEPKPELTTARRRPGGRPGRAGQEIPRAI
jgi:hypothetical protein